LESFKFSLQQRRNWAVVLPPLTSTVLVPCRSHFSILPVRAGRERVGGGREWLSEPARDAAQAQGRWLGSPTFTHTLRRPGLRRQIRGTSGHRHRLAGRILFGPGPPVRQIQPAEKQPSGRFPHRMDSARPAGRIIRADRPATGRPTRELWCDSYYDIVFRRVGTNNIICDVDILLAKTQMNTEVP
jgi:hypothetical protein